MKISLPQLSLVVLIGASGSGKSTFARRHFKPTEILSSDACRALVSDNENDQAATPDAFDTLQFIAAKRLRRGLLTVIDATNVQPESRRPLVQLAREHDVLPVAIVLKLRDDLCHQRNRGRPDRDFGPHVVRNQCGQLRRSLRGLQREGFRQVHVLESPSDVDAVTIERQPLWNDRRADPGPFDVIGDVHGCFDELIELLAKLGYDTSDPARPVPPPGRRALFLGDLVDRGPASPAVLRLAMNMTAAGHALCVPGNHDVKLLKKLRGKDVLVAHGLAETLKQLESEPPEFHVQAADFIDRLVSHYVLDGGRLVVAHAGIKEQYVGRASSRVRDFCLFGETTGETDDDTGLPVRIDWAAEYRGPATIVYGHTPVAQPQWLNRTINIDTGCVFGGHLTGLRWPERELVAVAAKQTYAQPLRPLNPEPQTLNPLSPQHQSDDLLDLADVIGKRVIHTALAGNVTIREENAIAALEVMSRFAANPKWLIYLPPTMSPSETSDAPGYLERPEQAFDYFAATGVVKVVCEQKHMGSRAVVVICRDETAATNRFGVAGEGLGLIYTRTGRRFFDNGETERQLLAHVHESLTAADFWARFDSDWFCLDCELMPWSAKAQELLRQQYAAVGAASRAALADVESIVATANARHDGALEPLLSETRDRRSRAGQFVDAYRQYCWPVRSVSDLKLAPFHLLASEGAVHADKNHLWHMTTLTELARPGSPLMATAHLAVDLDDPASRAAAIAWWEDLTARGGEGMVVKPLDFVARGPRGIVQPAVKCRGREYLRIIYGPEYDAPPNLARLRARGLGGKRSLAIREFALGLEALNRFVAREPLRAVHECTFGVLAFESEPVDPRL